MMDQFLDPEIVVEHQFLDKLVIRILKNEQKCSHDKKYLPSALPLLVAVPPVPLPTPSPLLLHLHAQEQLKQGRKISHLFHFCYFSKIHHFFDILFYLLSVLQVSPVPLSLFQEQ